MNITSAQYLKSEFDGSISTIKATIDEQEMSVPIDTGNRHYQAILECKQETANEIQAAE